RRAVADPAVLRRPEHQGPRPEPRTEPDDTGQVVERPRAGLGRVEEGQLRLAEEEGLCGDDLDPAVVPEPAVRIDLGVGRGQRLWPDLRRRDLDPGDAEAGEQVRDGR